MILWLITGVPTGVLTGVPTGVPTGVEGGKMVVVSISETYDLHTVVGKMTTIGIHTPQKTLIKKMYPGLCMNFKYFKILKQDVVLSTAQTLPLGVDEIGLDSGQINPQDMMNPILYKAVSNDSFSTLEARIMSPLGNNVVTTDVEGSMAYVEQDGVTGIADEHGVYYSLLSNHDGFRLAHPQQGLEMRGLVPLVFEKLYNVGENVSDTNDNYVTIGQNEQSGAIQRLTRAPRSMRGRAHPMPRMNTTFVTSAVAGDGTSYQNGMSPGFPGNYQTDMPDIPPCMLGVIILPPVSATTGILYYRMTTRCYIDFTDPRPISEITSFAEMNSDLAPFVYHTDYDEQSKIMDQTTDMADIRNGSIQKIMEGR